MPLNNMTNLIYKVRTSVAQPYLKISYIGYKCNVQFPLFPWLHYLFEFASSLVHELPFLYGYNFMSQVTNVLPLI